MSGHRASRRRDYGRRQKDVRSRRAEAPAIDLDGPELWARGPRLAPGTRSGRRPMSRGTVRSADQRTSSPSAARAAEWPSIKGRRCPGRASGNPAQRSPAASVRTPVRGAAASRAPVRQRHPCMAASPRGRSLREKPAAQGARRLTVSGPRQRTALIGVGVILVLTLVGLFYLSQTLEAAAARYQRDAAARRAGGDAPGPQDAAGRHPHVRLRDEGDPVGAVDRPASGSASPSPSEPAERRCSVALTDAGEASRSLASSASSRSRP